MKDNSKEKQPEDKKDFNKDKRIEEMKDNDKRNILHLAILTKDEKIIQKVIAFLGKPYYFFLYDMNMTILYYSRFISERSLTSRCRFQK